MSKAGPASGSSRFWNSWVRATGAGGMGNEGQVCSSSGPRVVLGLSGVAGCLGLRGLSGFYGCLVFNGSVILSCFSANAVGFLLRIWG